jgi:cytochrome P450
MHSLAYFIYAFLSIVLTLTSYNLFNFGRWQMHLPPGPPTIPILGNAHQIPTRGLLSKLKEWALRYGDVISLKAGKTTIISITSREAVYEIIDKPGMLVADRPPDKQFETAFAGEMILTMHNNALWRAQREVLAKFLGPRRLGGEMETVQDAEFVSFASYYEVD